MSNNIPSVSASVSSADQTNIRDLCIRAGSDPTFAESLLNSPEDFREEYNLTDEQCQQIKVLFSNGLLGEIALQNDSVVVASGSYY
jgi:hypothetical protein